MSANPTLRRIADIHAGETAERTRARAALDLLGSVKDACATCPRPVWFTAFFDGTGNNYPNDGSGSTRVEAVKYSNVAKLAHFGHVINGTNPRTAYEYIEGVGTPCPKVGDSGEGTDKAAGMAAAAKGEMRIRWMLNELKKHVAKFMPFVNQINLAVFGFSRGATQARAFVRMLTEELCYEQGDNKLYWRESGADYKQPLVVVYFLGIFDTVSSTGFGGSRLEVVAPAAVGGVATLLTGGNLPLGVLAGGVLHGINKDGHAEWSKDLRIPKYVRRCVHYVAAHEVREKFPSDSVREDQELPGNCVELFYPGMHSDVGGGYEFRSQEMRTNELARVPLNNMFIEAWIAGVPLKPPATVLGSAGPIFEISPELEAAWNVYMGQGGVHDVGQPPSPGKLETAVIWHMNRYYQWRESRRRRLRDGRLKPAGGVDFYMKITDSEWEKDVTGVAGSRTGYIRTSVYANEEAMYEAYTGKWIKSLGATQRQLFDKFFDHYVHDSIAGFKLQMTEGHIGMTELSRWSVNRKIFMGKRGEKFLYWRYEGWTPEYSGTKVSMTEGKRSPEQGEGQAAGIVA